MNPLKPPTKKKKRKPKSKKVRLQWQNVRWDSPIKSLATWIPASIRTLYRKRAEFADENQKKNRENVWFYLFEKHPELLSLDDKLLVKSIKGLSYATLRYHRLKLEGKNPKKERRDRVGRPTNEAWYQQMEADPSLMKLTSKQLAVALGCSPSHASTIKRKVAERQSANGGVAEPAEQSSPIQ